MQAADHTGFGGLSTALDEETKRLLAAILEFLAVMRRDEPPQHEGEAGLALGRAIRDHGLGTRHLISLLSVALWGPLSVTQLADRHHVLVKTASLLAVELEGAGLIERREDPADRRRTILSIPGSKQHLIDEALRRRAIPLRRTLDRLSPAEREGLIAGLESLASVMSGRTEPAPGSARSIDPDT